MNKLITSGIQISVKTYYKGAVNRNDLMCHYFNYVITIENKSAETVQLTHRFWKITDSLNFIETVSGEGVIGQTPVLKPNEGYTYQSGCMLISNMGAMSGFYTMKNVRTNENFRVYIPTFQLQTLELSN